MTKSKLALLFGLALMIFQGCGYTLSSSPYGLGERLTVGVPVVKNNSRFDNLGPMMTTELVNRLDAAPDISVREGASARLTVTIIGVSVSGGAWNITNANTAEDLYTDSASRVVNISLEAVFERPNPRGGDVPLVRRRVFSGSRNFQVGSDQLQVDLLQQEAFAWLINDLGQKIAQAMFSEF